MGGGPPCASRSQSAGRGAFHEPIERKRSVYRGTSGTDEGDFKRRGKRGLSERRKKEEGNLVSSRVKKGKRRGSDLHLRKRGGVLPRGRTKGDLAEHYLRGGKSLAGEERRGRLQGFPEREEEGREGKRFLITPLTG